MTTRVRLGAGQPYAYTMIVPKDATFDPSIVTAAVFMVTRPGPDGTTVEEEWPASLTDQSANSVTVVHPYALGEPSTLGTYRIWAQFTAPDMTPGPRNAVDTFIVIGKDAPR